MYKQSYMARAAAAMAMVGRFSPAQVLAPSTVGELQSPAVGGRHRWKKQHVSPRVAMRRKSRSRRVHGAAKRHAA